MIEKCFDISFTRKKYYQRCFMQKEFYGSFMDLLSNRKGEKHAIILQNYPDPDAISCAYSHKLICKKFDIHCDILYDGIVSHQENKALITLLEIQMIKYTPELNIGDYKHTIFLDNQGTTTSLTNIFQRAGIEPLLIIDHHERQNMIKAKLEYIVNIGATATIYAQLIEYGAYTLNSKEFESKAMATALMHGIRTETESLITASKEDYQAATYLSDYYNKEMLLTISNQKRNHKAMNIISKALEKRSIKESFSISGIGYLRHEERDAIPQAADFLLTESNIHTSIVYGILTDEKNREFLIGSMRTNNITLEPDNFLKEVFGKDDKGHFYGGGKKQAGAFEIPVGFLSGELSRGFSDKKWELYDEIVKQKLFSKIGVEDGKRS